MKEKSIHEGRNVKRLRETLQVKKEALAKNLKLSQEEITKLEGKETLDKDILEKVAKALKVSKETIKTFSDDIVINIMTFHDYYAVNLNYQSTVNPIDKLTEALEENKILYERLLQSEKDKVELLERLNGKK